MLKCKYYNPKRFYKIIMLAFDMIKTSMYRIWLLQHRRLYCIVVSWAILKVKCFCTATSNLDFCIVMDLLSSLFIFRYSGVCRVPEIFKHICCSPYNFWDIRGPKRGQHQKWYLKSDFESSAVQTLKKENWVQFNNCHHLSILWIN